MSHGKEIPLLFQFEFLNFYHSGYLFLYIVIDHLNFFISYICFSLLLTFNMLQILPVCKFLWYFEMYQQCVQNHILACLPCGFLPLIIMLRKSFCTAKWAILKWGIRICFSPLLISKLEKQRENRKTKTKTCKKRQPKGLGERSMQPENVGEL